MVIALVAMKTNESRKTFTGVCLLLIAVLAIVTPGAHGKWVHKVIKEQEEMPDVFVTKFCFAAEGEGSVSVTAQSNTKGQSLLFFDESPSSWPTVLATYYELSCGALRNLSMLIMIDEENDAKTEGLELPLGYYETELGTLKRDTPKFWYVMASNCEDDIDLDVTMSFLNPGGFFYSQFSTEEQGLLQLSLVFLAIYGAGCAFYMRNAFLVMHRSNSLHPMVLLLTSGLLFQLLCLFLRVIHFLLYAHNGVGVPAFDAIGEVAEDTSNLVIMMFLILVAKGYTIRAKEQPSRRFLSVLAALVLGNLLVFVLERVARSDAAIFSYDTSGGTIVILLRVAFCMYYAFAIRNAYLDPAQADQQRFFLIFGCAGCVWFLSLPFVVLISPAIPIWERLRWVAGMGLFIHTVGLAALCYIVWPNRADQYMSLAFSDDLAGSTPYDDI
jgi:hypothetical protein